MLNVIIKTDYLKHSKFKFIKKFYHLNFIIQKKSQQFKIVNDYLIKLQKNNALGNSHK